MYEQQKIADKLNKMYLPDPLDIMLPEISFEEIKLNARAVVSKLWSGVDTNVAYFKPENESNIRRMYQVLDKTQLSDNAKLKMLIDAYKKQSMKVNIFDVPVKVNRNIMYPESYYHMGPQLILGDPDEFLDKVPVYAEFIELGTKKCNKIN